MKPLALLFSLLLAACASNDGFQTERSLECGPGQLVTLELGLAAFAPSRMEGMDDQHTLAVLVANNSEQDIVVKYIRIDQRPERTSIYRLDNGYLKPNQTIAEGKDFEFKIPMAGRAVSPEFGSSTSANRSIGLDVTVGLGNGDRYHCQFEVPMR